MSQCRHGLLRQRRASAHNRPGSGSQKLSREGQEPQACQAKQPRERPRQRPAGPCPWRNARRRGPPASHRGRFRAPRSGQAAPGSLLPSATARVRRLRGRARTRYEPAVLRAPRSRARPAVPCRRPTAGLERYAVRRRPAWPARRRAPLPLAGRSLRSASARVPETRLRRHIHRVLARGPRTAPVPPRPARQDPVRRAPDATPGGQDRARDRSPRPAHREPSDAHPASRAGRQQSGPAG